ncbi:hypothetical protein [Oxynema aestuarii]|uniref:Uncharacterized protein n=1 Tax=Oxynema aestuarii AP17 TaxID=2064643 RepID=A0A6H1U4Q3_9CYAN|nr:hypothetical protein [Oxynema aestuarii]QIZ73406.1 hypothetical protein HCG48_24700 [Oxynema aestuarii AP17]RMH74385.1 MAG: hypothetical protein D6680_15025 [Cyanobacteria bacterium J007]
MLTGRGELAQICQRSDSVRANPSSATVGWRAWRSPRSNVQDKCDRDDLHHAPIVLGDRRLGFVQAPKPLQSRSIAELPSK